MAIPSAIHTHDKQFHQPPDNNICQITLQMMAITSATRQQHLPKQNKIVA